MSRFPVVEAGILGALEETGEAHPPKGRLAEEYFWEAASVLQSRGLCVADQAAGVVRRSALKQPNHEGPRKGTQGEPAADLPPKKKTAAEDLLRAFVDVLQPLESDEVSTYPSAWEIDVHGDLDGEEWGNKVREVLREAEGFLEATSHAPVADLPGRLRLLISRWRFGAYQQCAIDLEEVLEETGGKPKEDGMSYECSECERDLRGGHDPECSRFVPEYDEEEPAFDAANEIIHQESETDPVGAKLAEQEIRVENLTGETVLYQMLGSADESPLDELEAALAGEETRGRRFGDRLRQFARHEQGYTFVREACEEIADAIDQDAAGLQAEIDDLWRVERSISDAMVASRAKNRDLRRQVEEAVERLRYGVHLGLAAHSKDVLDAEAFLAELGQIFGDSTEEKKNAVR